MYIQNLWIDSTDFVLVLIIIIQPTHLHSTIIKEASVWKNGHQYHLEETGHIF